MKNLLLVGIMIISCFNALSQEEKEETNPTDKGHFIVDGSVFFSTNTSKSEQDGFNTKSESFGFGFSPKAAYFVIDRLALGLEVSLNYTNNEFTNNVGGNSSGNSTGIFVGPFARYYLSNGIFGQAALGFGSSKSDRDGFENKNDVFRYQLGIGYAIFLNQNVSLEPLLNYQHNKSSSDQSAFDTTNSGFTLGAGFTIYL